METMEFMGTDENIEEMEMLNSNLGGQGTRIEGKNIIWCYARISAEWINPMNLGREYFKVKMKELVLLN